MADGGDNSERRDNRPDTVRRQVVIAVRTVIDIPADWTEAETKHFVENDFCPRELFMALADEIDYDNEEIKEGRRAMKEKCDVCLLSTLRLVPPEQEIQSNWLENFGLEEEDED